MDHRPLLLCYDGSEDAKRALSAVATLFAARRAVVLDVGPLQVVVDAYAAAGSNAAEIDRVVRDAAAVRADAGAALARELGLDAEARADLEAPTWLGVTEVAEEIDAAAIVIGSRGLSGLRALLAGSLSHQVAVHAGRPVLVVPPPK